MKCDQCEKIVPTGETLKRSKGWWKVESSAFDGEEGADFCSDVCARNFFADRVIKGGGQGRPPTAAETCRQEDGGHCTRENLCVVCAAWKEAHSDRRLLTAAETCPLSPPCYKCVESKQPGPRSGEHLYPEAHATKTCPSSAPPCRECAESARRDYDNNVKVHEIDYDAPSSHPGVVLEPETPPK